MINEGITTGKTTTPTRKVVAEWIDAVLMGLKGKTTIIKNAWRKTGFEWFEWGI